MPPVPVVTLSQPKPSFTCHWTVGVGVPEAAAVNVAVLPAVRVWLLGWVMIDGAVLDDAVRVTDVAV